MSKEDIYKVEKEIDDAFSDSDLTRVNYGQAAWFILSVAEDHQFKIRAYQPLERWSLDIYTDGLMNSLTHPLRACLKSCSVSTSPINRQMNNDLYGAANDWIDRAISYDQFCSIFPLYHNNEIELSISGKEILTTDWSKLDLSYEAYDRFIKRRHSGDEIESIDDQGVLVDLINLNTTFNKRGFHLNYNPKLVEKLRLYLDKSNSLRFSLPENWIFSHFSISEFKEVFLTIQSMAFGWFVARVLAANNGAEYYAFNNAIWVPRLEELTRRLKRYTGIAPTKISKIIEYLTFGSCGVRQPDIAIQPIVNPGNGELIICPFLFMNSNCERNLCVLLNQITEEQRIYSQLVNEKEKKLREEVCEKIRPLGFEFSHGHIDGTDIDLAIIDRRNKKCLSIELKWFIEPAEIREVLQRSKEVKKGVAQARKILSAWERGDGRLLRDVLKVESDYEFLSMVSPVTSIGTHSAQDLEIPVVKTWHLVDEILSRGELGSVIEWLRKREYLPVQGVDFTVHEMPLKTGEWTSVWYGLKTTETIDT
ncbi:hypothetical protein P3W53_00905 [Pseudomonas denitrificans (nom. rej.)]|nr:hypothetical protein [Pseudomonas denitrificans (nom. rej.)]